ncbi:Clan SC, family S28, unassigned serine peptidase [Tritrichomonas foetus]|uniref:Clan SC, family S28, unassigned serine peptidase n=1 Tax=Tritrichomonas foetus TaxID=1144522 RepID=A0A1J4KJ08_9EUKA|nr:Clan SC, family S28, unassigned serine peptidase [Tritrichomonas foetus]|eukprot:OHT10920.1 Clan SC, family S28, unassigned serine peptidase [Tritrichomonas foetus]
MKIKNNFTENVMRRTFIVNVLQMMILFFLFSFRAESTIYQSTFPQRLNHFDTHSNIFFNQTYLSNFSPNSTLKSPSLIIYLGGRSPISSDIFNSTALKSLASQTDAKIIALEHRFFGSSFPTDGVTDDNLKYLIIQQVLADIDHFLEFVQRRFCPVGGCNIGLVGASYAGSLAAWSRVRYPHLSVGSWSSSSPLKFVTEFPEYDAFVASYLNKVKNGCLNSTQVIFNEIENIILNGDEEAKSDLKKKFGIEINQTISTKNESDDVSFLYVIAEVLSLPIEKPSHSELLQKHCSVVTNSTLNYGIDSFSEIFKEILKTYEMKISDFDPYQYRNDVNLKSKLWLQCNQFGWFKTSSGKLRSKMIDLNFFNDVCLDTFSINISDSSITNEDFGGIDPYLSNAVFTNSEEDPYSVLSVKTGENVMGRFAYSIEDAGASSDIFSFTNTNETLGAKLISVQKNCISRMRQWILKECEKKCYQGTCVLSKCVCIDMWDGEFCDRRTHTGTAYTYISAFCILVPTILLLFFGSFVWFCGNKEETEIGNSRRSFFTN